MAKQIKSLTYRSEGLYTAGGRSERFVAVRDDFGALSRRSGSEWTLTDEQDASRREKVATLAEAVEVINGWLADDEPGDCYCGNHGRLHEVVGAPEGYAEAFGRVCEQCLNDFRSDAVRKV